jgi:uncharacterized OB-fold protein
MAYNKPIPVPQGESDVYWQKAKQGELWLRYCNSCKEAYFFPTDICRAIPCANPRDTTWIQASGKATLYTFAIVGYETGKAPHPGFEAPYVTAIVELEEGPTIAKVYRVALPDAWIQVVSLGLAQGIALQISVGKKYASLQLLQYLSHSSPCFAFCQ